MTATELGIAERLVFAPAGTTGAAPSQVVAEIYDAIRHVRQRDGGGSSLTVRIARMSEHVGWLVTVPESDDEEQIARLVGSVHAAAVTIAAEAVLALDELDPQLKHRPHTHLQRWLRDALKDRELKSPERWDRMLQLGLTVTYDLSRLALADGTRRIARHESSDSKTPLEHALYYLQRMAIDVATFVAWTDCGDAGANEAAVTLLVGEPDAHVEIVDPEQELTGLRRRAQALGGALGAASEELAADGRPFPAALLDDLDRYGRDVERLAQSLGSVATFSSLGQRLLDRDPRRRALRALAHLEVTEDASLPAAEEVRERASGALAAYDADVASEDVEPLCWLHDWILVHRDPERSRARSDVVMRQLLAAGIATTLAIQPDVDRLRLGAIDEHEPTLVFADDQALKPSAPVVPDAVNSSGPPPEPPPETERESSEKPDRDPSSEPEQPVEPDSPLEPAPDEVAEASEHVEPGPPPPDDAAEPDGPGAEATAESPAAAAMLTARGFPGIAACCLPSEDPRAAVLELLAIAIAARSSSGDSTAELARRIYELDDQIALTNETRQIALAAAMACSITAPASWIEELLERVAPAAGPALEVIREQLRRLVRQRFEIGRDLLAGDAASLGRRSAQLADDARRWLDKPGRTRMQRASRLWRDWVDEREGRLGQMLARVAAQDAEQAAALRGQMRDFHENLERHFEEDDHGLRGHGSSPLEGRARREIMQRVGEVLQLVDEAIEVWESLLAIKRDTREHSPRGPLFATIEKVLSTQLSPARADVERLKAQQPLGSAALMLALDVLERMVVLREGLPAGGEPPVVEALRGRLLACDVPLDEELRPTESIDQVAAELICTSKPDWQRAFDTRLRAGELHHAWRIRNRLVLEGCDPQQLQLSLEARAKELERDLRVEADNVRLEIDQSWRLGKLSHERCTGLFQTLEAIELTFDDPDASLREDLEQLRIELREDTQEHLGVRRDALRRDLAELGPDDTVRGAIDRLLAADDIASAEDAIQMLRSGARPTLALDQDLVADIRDFMRLCSELDGAELPFEDVQASVRGGQELMGLDFSSARDNDAEEAVARGLQQWYALRDDNSLMWGSKQHELREHVHAILQLVGFGVVGLTQRAPVRKRGNVRAVDFDLLTLPRSAPGLAPQFGTEARTLRVVLLVGGRAGPDELIAAIREDSELPCIALLPRTLTAKQRRRLSALQRDAPTASPVLFIDTAALLFICARGAMNLRSTMRITLPFTAVNPYRPFRAGPVPPEIFFGRKLEIAGLLAKEGPALIYGGRRLGKSALLHAVKHRAEESKDPVVAIVIDLKAAGIGERNPPSALLPLLIETVGRELKTPSPAGRLADRERLARCIAAWLELDERRRVVLLMDEADAFLQADADAGFETTNALQALQVRFDGRFKPVLAGLHQVKRFNDIPNQRITHLGDRVAVGPLATTEALQLIEEPLAALGFCFEQASATHRILAASRNQPSLIQLVCHHLVRHLMSRPPEQLPPYAITQGDVDDVLGRPAVASEMRERLDLTLNLDSRYRVILLVIALDLLERNVERPLRASEIQRRCEEWWPVGFVEATDYAFDALLEEMVELGLLYKDGQDGYRVQSRSVIRLLGTPDEIENELLRAGSLRLPDRFNAATYRESLESPSHGPRDPDRRNPLTVEQVEELCRRERRIAVVVGTEATGIGSIGDALERSGLDDQHSGGQRRGVTVVMESAADDAEAQRAFLRQLRRVGRRVHKLVVLVRHPDSRVLRELIVEGARTVGSGKQSDETVCGVITAPATGPVVRQLLDVTRPEEEEEVAGRPCILLPLRRWDATGLRAWALDDTDGAALPFAADRWLEALLATTGGWPSLVNQVVSETRARRAGAFVQVLRDLRKELASDEGAARMLASVGLSPGEDPETAVWTALVRYQEPIPLTRSIAHDLGTLAQLRSEEDARLAYETLRLKDVLVIDEETRTVATESIVRDAWTTLYPS